MSEPVLSQSAKHSLVYEHAREYGVLVETGLHNGHGATVAWASELTCYALDLDRMNVNAAREAGVEAFDGDSAIMLPLLLVRLSQPVCFWLDAHLVAEADEENSSPLMAELEAILAWEHARESTVLIDDLRMMGRDGWPTVGEVRLRVRGVWRLEEKDDVMRLTPRRV